MINGVTTPINCLIKCVTGVVTLLIGVGPTLYICINYASLPLVTVKDFIGNAHQIASFDQ